MVRPPDRCLLTYLASYDPHISDLTLALREVVLEEAPNAIESIVKTYAVSIGFSFTGKPLKDGFCHIVTYASHVNLGFNQFLRRYLQAAIEQVGASPGRH
jgi:hypothetical protein